MTKEIIEVKETEENEVKVLTQEDLALIEKRANDIDITDSQSIILFGSETQTEIADFSDIVLEQVRSKDTGYVGDILSSLLVNLEDVDAKSLSEKGGWFSSLKKEQRS